MAKTILVDTGPLVAFFNRNDQYHTWAVDAFTEQSCTLLTCEAVISEVVFITKNDGRVTEALSGMIRDGFLQIHNALGEAPLEIIQMVEKYSDLPGSLADLCLVWLSEKTEGTPILTLDSDFHISRNAKGNPLSFRLPE